MAAGNYTAAGTHINQLSSTDPDKDYMQILLNIKQSGRDIHEMTEQEVDTLLSFHDDGGSGNDPCVAPFPEHYEVLLENEWEEPPLVINPLNVGHQPQVDDTVKPSISTPVFEKLEVFPNPTTGILNINWQGESEVQLGIYALDGTLVWAGKATGKSRQVDIGWMPAGLYFVQARGEEGLWQRKVVKQ